MNVAKPILDGALARRPEDPFDEAGGQQQGDYAKGHGRDAKQAASILANDIPERVKELQP